MVDYPDGSPKSGLNGVNGVLEQIGTLVTFTSGSELASGANHSGGFTNNSDVYLYRVVGMRFVCFDGTIFRVYVNSSTYGHGYYLVTGMYEFFYPEAVNLFISKGDYVTTNLINMDTSTRYLRSYITTMRYIKPSNWVRRPDAYFTVDDSTPAVDQTITFTDGTAFAPTSWHWVFGDGTESYEQSPTHAYSVAGTYTVWLYVENIGGADAMTMSITVT